MNRRRGREGEKRVRKALRHQGLFAPYHKVLNGIILIDRKGDSHEIDHIDIRRSGIFCIETKTIAGRIEGRPDDPVWHSYLPERVHEHRNPIMQNEVHVRTLREVLGKDFPIYGVVVFTDDNAGTIAHPGVINLSDLRDYLRKHGTRNVLSRKDVRTIRRTLKSCRTISHRKHVKAIAKKYS